jgi:hypothetical protein
MTKMKMIIKPRISLKDAKAKKSDTLNLILSNAINRDMSDFDRAMAIKRTAKNVRDRTICPVLRKACVNLIKHASKGDYEKVILTLEISEQRWYEQYT